MSEPEKLEISKPKRDPAALSCEYHKAHKQLMLWSTVLFIWELVGVELSKAKDAGGNIGPIITALKSPQAVPWVLLVLVLYFLFKCSVEWAQCHVERRRTRFARLDFTAAWIVSLAAISLYIGQTVSRVQFADLFRDEVAQTSLFVGGIVGLFGALFIVLWKSFLLRHKILYITVVLVFPVMLLLDFGRADYRSWIVLLIASALPIAVVGALLLGRQFLSENLLPKK